jgi:hypothetical protein
MKKTIALTACLTFTSPTFAQTYGPERVTDGSFTEGATYWTLGYSWQAIPGPLGVAFHNEGYTAQIEQSTALLTAGATYEARYTITGSFTSTDPRHWFRFRGTAGVANCPIRSGDGIFICTIVAPVGAYSLQVRPAYGFAGVLDDVSVREVLP